ncbi:MAG: DUF4153 domain-containing protein [Bacteroidota bacterium]|nr:DUF4153 domain-containing protein [Bacteroidota bacterium]
MQHKINLILDKADRTIRKFPLVIISSILCTVFAIYSIEVEGNLFQKETFSYGEMIYRLAFVFNLGISVFFGVKIAEERYGRSLWFNLVGVGLLVCFYFILSENEFLKSNYTIEFPIYTASIYAGVHLLIAFIAYLRTKDRTENCFWEYNKNLFLNFIISGMFALVLLLGLCLSYYAIEELFGIGISDKVYVYTLLICGIFVKSFIFLSFSESLANLERTDRPYPMVLKFFVQFIIIPLLLLYGLILYTYAIKILFTWTLPQGGVSYMIMGYCLVGILTYLLVYPLTGKDTRTWVRVFFKLFYKTMFPLIILLYVAIFTRVLEYGITENRYFVLIFALWLTVVLSYFVFRKDAQISFIPTSLFVIIFVAVFMPFTNAFNISKWSQKIQMMKILQKANVLENGVINFEKSISEDDLSRFREKVMYFRYRKDMTPILEVVPDSIKSFVIEDFDDGIGYTYIPSYFTNVVSSDGAEQIDYVDDYLKYHREKYDSNIDVPQGYHNFIFVDNLYCNKAYTIDENVELIPYIDEMILKTKDEKYTYQLKEQIEKYIKTSGMIDRLIPPRSTEETEERGITKSSKAPHIYFKLGGYEFVFIPSSLDFRFNLKTKEFVGIEEAYYGQGHIFYRLDQSEK